MTYASDEAIANAQWNAANEVCITEAEKRRPSVLYKPQLFAYSNKWCVLLGENLLSGLASFGDTAEEAMRNFDTAWVTERPPTTSFQIKELISDDSQFGVGA